MELARKNTEKRESKAEHYIKVTPGLPVACRLRRLAPDKLKAAIGISSTTERRNNTTFAESLVITTLRGTKTKWSLETMW